MAFATMKNGAPPLGEINTTPLIDVMLVLLVMLIFTIPISTNSLDVDLPNGNGLLAKNVANKVVVTTEGRILWNGTPVTREQLRSTLRSTKAMVPEPELQFEPEALASYDLAASVMNDIKGSGVTKFGFVGNERFKAFGAGE